MRAKAQAPRASRACLASAAGLAAGRRARLPRRARACGVHGSMHA